MKKITLILAMLVANMAWAQFAPKTGDAEMDAHLTIKNDEGKKNPVAFVDNVVNTFGLMKGEVDKLMKIMAPGDVYMAAQMAHSLGKPVTEVANTYNAHKDKGWGAIAKEMGIKPGSPEFHKMKKEMKSHGNGHGKDKEEKGEKGEKGDKDDDGGEGKGKGHGKGGHGHGKK